MSPPVIEIDGLAVGFATCYDLRFPELFRVLQSSGAQVLALASAWVKGPLKEEHWLTLLRARAIENTCYMVAADQSGRAGIGRSAAFDPFGLPLLDLGNADSGYGLVDVSPDRLAEVRKVLPATSASALPHRAGTSRGRSVRGSGGWDEIRHRPTAGADRAAQGRPGAVPPLRPVGHRVGAPHRGRAEGRRRPGRATRVGHRRTPRRSSEIPGPQGNRRGQRDGHGRLRPAAGAVRRPPDRGHRG